MPRFDPQLFVLAVQLAAPATAELPATAKARNDVVETIVNAYCAVSDANEKLRHALQ